MRRKLIKAIVLVSVLYLVTQAIRGNLSVDDWKAQAAEGQRLPNQDTRVLRAKS